jgi:mono/diheme cytochrome c family protein
MTRTALAVTVGLGLLVGACTISRQPPESPVVKGRALFQEHGCYGCHTISGTGTPIAPDLSHAGAKYSEGELARLLSDPAIHRPGAHMPKLELSEAETRALAAYLASLQ